MAERPTGTCRHCGRRFRLTMRDGIWPHGNGVKDSASPVYRQNCPGSGQDPRERLRMGRDYTPADVFRAHGEPVPPVWAQYEREHLAALSTQPTEEETMLDPTPPTVVNPGSIGDPNQTPVVYIGDAGEVLGIPERATAVDLDAVFPPEPLTFRRLADTNAQRCRRWHPGFPKDSWTGADWSNAMQGEAGEAGNVVKKLRRAELGTQGALDPPPADLVAKLGDEIADTVIYADLLAQYYGLDLAECITRKFDAVSVREGFPERLAEETNR